MTENTTTETDVITKLSHQPLAEHRLEVHQHACREGALVAS